MHSAGIWDDLMSHGHEEGGGDCAEVGRGISLLCGSIALGTCNLQKKVVALSYVCILAVVVVCICRPESDARERRRRESLSVVVLPFSRSHVCRCCCCCGRAVARVGVERTFAFDARVLHGVWSVPRAALPPGGISCFKRASVTRSCVIIFPFLFEHRAREFARSTSTSSSLRRLTVGKDPGWPRKKK